MKKDFFTLLLASFTINLVASWAPSQQVKEFGRLKSSIVDSDVMEGASKFEDWFASVKGAAFSSELKHEDFGNLRGLTIGQYPTSKEEAIITVPRSVVLSSDFSKPDWDAELAQKVWFECTKGSTSSISGYVALLTRGWTPAMLPELPPSTAPDALRHWTDDEKSALSGSAVGQRLLNLERQQDELWEAKFRQTNGMTFEQFRWAMEVVHSRAFQGDFGIGGSPIPPVQTLAVPVVAALSSFKYYYQNPDANDLIMVFFAAFAALPTILNLLTQGPPVACLLPMIDSINHLEEADSTINYNPLSDSFSLLIGDKCILQEGGKKQLYISYGAKKDSELLLNYGFLKGVESDGDTSKRRQALADTFVERNS